MPYYERRGRGLDWVNLFLAIFLFVSPWVVGYVDFRAPAWDAWLMGIFLFLVAVSGLNSPAFWERVIEVVGGVYVLAAPWIWGFHARMGATWSHVALGTVIALVALRALTHRRPRPDSEPV